MKKQLIVFKITIKFIDAKPKLIGGSIIKSFNEYDELLSYLETVTDLRFSSNIIRNILHHDGIHLLKTIILKDNLIEYFYVIDKDNDDIHKFHSQILNYYEQVNKFMRKDKLKKMLKIR